MGEFTNLIAIVFGVLVACFAGPGAARFVLIRREAKARQSRRTPIGIAMLRGPGPSLRAVYAEGVSAVETKGFTKPNQGRGKADATVVYDGETLRFPTWTTKEPLEQAERQAAWLAKWLSSAVGSPTRSNSGAEP